MDIKGNKFGKMDIKGNKFGKMDIWNRMRILFSRKIILLKKNIK